MPRLLFRCLEWPDLCAGSERGGMPELMQEREPYVAAVVASMDRYMGKYGAHVQLQGPKVAIVLVRLPSMLCAQQQSGWRWSAVQYVVQGSAPTQQILMQCQCVPLSSRLIMRTCNTDLPDWDANICKKAWTEAQDFRQPICCAESEDLRHQAAEGILPGNSGQARAHHLLSRWHL